MGSLGLWPYLGLQEDPQYPTMQGFLGFLKGLWIGEAAVNSEADGFDQLPTVFAGSRGRLAASSTLVLPIYWAETPCVCQLHCSALQCTALHYIELQCTTLKCTKLHCTKLCCTDLQYTALNNAICITNQCEYRVQCTHNVDSHSWLTCCHIRDHHPLCTGQITHNKQCHTGQ